MTLRVMCVDDEDSILDMVQKQLERTLGSRVTRFRNPEEALSFLREDREQSGDGFDVILSDFNMPQMDGIEFLLQSKELFPNTRRIMLTAYGDYINWEDRMLDCQLAGFVTKPPNWVQLCYAVSTSCRFFQPDSESNESLFNGSVLLVKMEGLSSKPDAQQDDSTQLEKNPLGRFASDLASLVVKRYGYQLSLDPGETITFLRTPPYWLLTPLFECATGPSKRHSRPLGVNLY